MGHIDETGVWTRARRDLEAHWKGSALVGIIVGLVGALSDGLLPDRPSLVDRGFWFLGGMAAVGIAVFLFALARAPIIQRKEARAAHAEHHKPLNVEIRIRSTFVTKAPRGLQEPQWKLIRLGDIRITNRTAVPVNLGFRMVFDIGGGQANLWLDENPIARLQREGADGFAAFLDNPLRIDASDTQAGDLGFLVEPEYMDLVTFATGEDFDTAVRSARIQIVDHLSTQAIEVSNRNGTYQWGDHLLGTESLIHP